MNDINTKLDMGADAPSGYLGEAYCKTLHEYHKKLWSKQLPSGKTFDLELKSYKHKDKPEYYFLFCKNFKELVLTSDVMNTGWNNEWGLGGNWDWVKGLKDARSRLTPEEEKHYQSIIKCIGNYIIFPKGNEDNAPCVEVGGNWKPKYDRAVEGTTWGMNRARGLDDKICDRFDLTLECVRRWYFGIENNPLINAIKFSKDFFGLFGENQEGFKSYVQYFFLDDLVDEKYEAVKSFVQNETIKTLSDIDFGENFDPLPSNLDFCSFMNNVCDFIRARNERIASTPINLPLSPRRS